VRFDRIRLLCNIASFGWLGVLVLNILAAAFGRGDAAGEVMMAGCVFIATCVPVALYSLGILAWSARSWSSLPKGLRFQLVANSAAIVLVWLVSSIAWEVFSPYR
jgi:hypothetical protein